MQNEWIVSAHDLQDWSGFLKIIHWMHAKVGWVGWVLTSHEFTSKLTWNEQNRRWEIFSDLWDKEIEVTKVYTCIWFLSIIFSKLLAFMDLNITFFTRDQCWFHSTFFFFQVFWPHFMTESLKQWSDRYSWIMVMNIRINLLFNHRVLLLAI